MDKVNEKIVIQKEEKTIFTLKCNIPKKSKKGEVDIMIDTGKGMYFDNVVAGNYYRQYSFPRYKINALSWHGYYEIIDEKRLFTPIIHIKQDRHKVDRLWHLGSINSEEPFAFPVCSLYIPKSLNVDKLNHSIYDRGKELHHHIKNVSSDEDIRLDIFVLPKSISAEELIKSKIRFLYNNADIDLFNSPVGKLNWIEGANIETIENPKGNDIILRTVTGSCDMFKSVEGSFSLIVHDPNDIYNRMLNRPIIEVDEGDKVLSDKELLKKAKLLKDLHEEDIRLNDRSVYIKETYFDERQSIKNRG